MASFKNAVSLPGDEFWEKAIRCYTCAEVHTREIFYCENSHFLCQRCVKCECGSKPTKIRATFLENIVRKSGFWCENNCGFKLTNEEYAYHAEAACRCRAVPCVFCPIPQKYADYLLHMQRIHNIPAIKLDESGSALISLKPETSTVQHTKYQDKVYFIRWKYSKFWVLSYDINCTGIKVLLESSNSLFKQELKPARLHTEFKDIQHAKLKFDETYKITFFEAEEVEKSVVLTRHSGDGKWEMVLTEKVKPRPTTSFYS